MGYVKITAPRRVELEVKVNRTNLLFSAAGLASISQIAPALADAAAVNLWWDALTGKAAITAAVNGDPDGVEFERFDDGAKVSAKRLFEYASLKPGAKLASEQLEESGNGGVAVAFAGLSLPVPVDPSAPAPKKRGRKPKIPV